jgi:hypothetical protein
MQAHGWAALPGSGTALQDARQISSVLRASRNFPFRGWLSNMASFGRYCGDFLSGSTERIYVARFGLVSVTARNAN